MHMASFPLQQVAYAFGENTITVLLPEENAVQEWYNSNCKQADAFFPYWAKVWPAAMGMCSYLAQNPHLIKGKIVLELAAGLGMPSLLAARWASTIACTDITAEAVAVVQQAAAKNDLHNLEAFTLNWNETPPSLPQVVLLSDVNYDPRVFEELYDVMVRFLTAGVTIILSTPHRLIAKPFISRLIPFCVHQQLVGVQADSEFMDISILVLRWRQ